MEIKGGLETFFRKSYLVLGGESRHVSFSPQAYRPCKCSLASESGVRDVQ